MVLTCCKKRSPPWWAWRNGSIGIWKAAHFTAASRRSWRTSSPPFTASRWRTFWTTTPPVSAPGRRRLPPQIPGGKGLEPSAACRPRKGQPDKHPLLGKRAKDHQSEVLFPSGGKPWFRFSIYASHVRDADFLPGKGKSPSASHDMWQRRRAFIMESFYFGRSAICSISHGVP